MAWPIAVLGIGGPSGAGLGLLARERLATGPEGASARPHPRWVPVAKRDRRIPTFSGGEHRSRGRHREQAPRPLSGLSEGGGASALPRTSRTGPRTYMTLRCGCLSCVDGAAVVIG